ncbi:uncharacterized protein CTHT_0015720 [Thermochaetoides thermophila DSM 1495]|uniref:Uncharacterized protein n=1 Tax=Chaetomium thermophilum (strain DSM 1495 / CBS 144.50 / IMI 039719) TaxID=759272 RepID=G0S223_CHATD|nr:hypothetical protein CTHT_0015720 [Thermochaetoides thermophila DSM 1495]EGS23083.1 hypothetical protein CTHT_0015720 [Thermochaetoides thermophila DSM 1495]
MKLSKSLFFSTLLAGFAAAKGPIMELEGNFDFGHDHSHESYGHSGGYGYGYGNGYGKPDGSWNNPSSSKDVPAAANSYIIEEPSEASYYPQTTFPQPTETPKSDSDDGKYPPVEDYGQFEPTPTGSFYFEDNGEPTPTPVASVYDDSYPAAPTSPGYQYNQTSLHPSGGPYSETIVSAGSGRAGLKFAVTLAAAVAAGLGLL